ncbi:DNA translocase FtsK 4TM domain-containing protein [Roseomonas sp. PWR1]|uniref:DNA translocase FtsK n=1 Tax=Roseomonas nitratireducens TaxID=2820810 RepID=A0ABS4ATS8_9PROT|nr:DNA translocase FtsK [Neoroseomonas nitratireducens]MBP0464171.1 DNA translocase FtsK 4TM domain-containing protein [Neoroseomonas nitratireducens]
MPRAALTNESRASDAAAPGRFASAAVRAVLRRRLMELAGVLVALAAVGLLIALGSHDPADPSLNTASAGPTRNLAGPVGAIVSDVLLQSVGFAAVLPSLALLAWAFRLATHRGLGTFAARLVGLLAALPLGAAALSLMPVPPDLPVAAGAGGVAGPLVSGFVVDGLGGLFGPAGAMAGYAFVMVAAVGSAFIACGLTVGEWRGAGRAAVGAGQVAVGAARSGAAALRRPDAPEAPRPPRPGLFARLASPFSRMGREAAARFRREPTDVPLGAMLRAAEEAASAVPPSPAAPPAPLPGEDGDVRRGTEPEAKPRLVPRSKVQDRAQDRPRRVAEQRALDLGEGQWRLPPLDLLTEAPARRTGRPSEESLQANARLLESVLEDYGVRGRIAEIRPGPVVTLYELEPAPGTKSSRVIGLADDIARSMSVIAVRIATVPGRNVIGIEMPNAKRETVYLSEMFVDESWHRNQGRLPLALGKDIGGAPVIADLARMPHLLIAGTTGSGKSVGINTMILSLLYRFGPDECRFIMIDPKMLELSVYDRIPHLLAPVVTEPPKAIGALKWTVREMERRYRAMSQLGVRNIGGYNEKVAAARARGEVLTRKVQTGFDPETGKPTFEEQPLALEPLPMIVVVIDEMADLMIVAGKEIEAAVQRLAQMARAAGIHVIMATQRPSVDVITGTIKANFPTRISFQVTSKIDSRTILGEQGAEQLLGQGDMLHMPGGGRLARVHGPFVSDTEVERVVEFLRSQGEPQYIEEVTEAEDDDGGAIPGMLGGNTDGEASLYDQAVALVTREGKASTSFVQRHLNIGYNRAAKLIEQMEKEGVVGPANHVGKREVLAPGPRD